MLQVYTKSVLGFLCLLYCACASTATGSAPARQLATQPLMTTWTAEYVRQDVSISWQHARVYLPFTTTPTTLDRITAGKRWPVVLFMHGCWGFETQEHSDWGKFFAAQGLLVIMPDSFARPNHKRRCETIDDHGGVHPPVHDMRLAEIAYAKQQIEKQPWYDGKNLFLMGYSEGAIAAVRTPLRGFRGVIAASWTCTHRGYAPLHGIFLPPETPLLTLSYDNDSWFPQENLKGNCGQRMAGRLASRHITLPSQSELHRLMHKVDQRWLNIFNTQGHNHGTFHDAQARQAVDEFIHRLMRD